MANEPGKEADFFLEQDQAARQTGNFSGLKEVAHGLHRNISRGQKKGRSPVVRGKRPLRHFWYFHEKATTYRKKGNVKTNNGKKGSMSCTRLF
jgi:hypothetical protein